MAIFIKRGSREPTINDLQNFQLGFNTSNNHLYINNNGSIVDFNKKNNTYKFSFELSDSVSSENKILEANNLNLDDQSSYFGITEIGNTTGSIDNDYFPTTHGTFLDDEDIKKIDSVTKRDPSTNRELYSKMYKDIIIDNKLKIRIICWKTRALSVSLNNRLYSHEVYFQNIKGSDLIVKYTSDYDIELFEVLNYNLLTTEKTLENLKWYRLDNNNLWHWNHKLGLSFDNNENTWVLFANSALGASFANRSELNVIPETNYYLDFYLLKNDKSVIDTNTNISLS
jgi:hypothetical protein